MLYDHLYFDLMNLYYKQFYGRGERYVKISGQQFPVHGIEGTIQYIDRMKSLYLKEGGSVHICVDNYTSRPTLRKEIDPNYKQGRISQSSLFYKSLKTLVFALCYYDNDFFIYQFKGLEADDFTPALIENAEGANHLVISSDFDWARCINYKGDKIVEWHNCDHIVNRKEFIDKYGFEPTEANIVTYKTYRGDTSDNIPVGWPHLSSTLLEKLMEYGSVYDVLDDLEIIDFMTSKQKHQMREHKARLCLNNQLVSFIPVSGEVLKKSVFKARMNVRILKKLFTLLGIDNEKMKTHHRSSFPKVNLDNFFQ